MSKCLLKLLLYIYNGRLLFLFLYRYVNKKTYLIFSEICEINDRMDKTKSNWRDIIHQSFDKSHIGEQLNENRFISGLISTKKNEEMCVKQGGVKKERNSLFWINMFLFSIQQDDVPVYRVSSLFRQ